VTKYTHFPSQVALVIFISSGIANCQNPDINILCLLGYLSGSQKGGNFAISDSPEQSPTSIEVKIE
jgi:hypothetical protein